MTEWIVREADETLAAFDKRLTVWLMKHPTWAIVFDREIYHDDEDPRNPSTNPHTALRFFGWSHVRESAYLAIYKKYGGDAA